MATQQLSFFNGICQRKRINVEVARDLWFNKLYSLQMIGDKLGFSRAGIKKCLNKHGIDTSKAATRQNLICPVCGKTFKKYRAYARNTETPHCSKECYYKAIYNPDFVEWRHGTRIAREKISKVFDLQPEHIVHHIDSNERNNDMENLMVFKNQSDHMKWHRAGCRKSGATPLFDGSLC